MAMSELLASRLIDFSLVSIEVAVAASEEV